MLHAVPELLDALESRLVAGEDPATLLTKIRWSELVGWPEDQAGALALKRRLTSIQTLLAGLQSPLRATLIGLSGNPGYGRNGIPADASGLAPRLYEKA
ncbi:hypothetical protein [Geothrix sp.]|jgi:hypothetical protein|uniref:hypothetical protein n=1 Tax=Geothrix sp. TaxID=1962974 RepID=UPI0025B92F8D|nr:hypothetical protein [Geothrix sp.]